MFDPEDKSAYELTGQEPHAWLMEATQLKRAADLVRQELMKVFAAFPQGFTAHSRPPFEDISLFKSYMLLSGLALENLAKGILIGRNSTVVTPETFTLKGHNLLWLARQVAAPLSEHELDLLARLTAFVEWAGRYPIHLRAAENVHPSFVRTDPEHIDRLFAGFVAILKGEHPESRNVKFI
jgi:hypothetical protein